MYQSWAFEDSCPECTLSLANEYRWTHVIFESDSTLIVNKMSQPEEDLSTLSYHLREARRKLNADLHYKVFEHKKKEALVEALEKVKGELMVLGFISLLLTFGQCYISRICIPEEVEDKMLFCPKKYGHGDARGDCHGIGHGHDDDHADHKEAARAVAEAEKEVVASLREAAATQREAAYQQRCEEFKKRLNDMMLMIQKTQPHNPPS
ncbi:hypothetical protein F3Y22_tig00008468pilonHSYRG00004 [Hibiscus syriacus]|uniref:Uncharacterized protein n=1 Tax=Hibiscus syriacus TaxID=106335 RepID=A0A6A3C9Y9_HIBSY|nr:hypothetical protein F3Y22_tig00008468pilonHSYRG00004 [Hibiscus syriacus]